MTFERHNSMLSDGLLDAIDDAVAGASAIRGRMSAVSDAEMATSGYVCGWRFRVPQIGEDFAIVDGEDDDGIEVGKFIRVLTPGLYISQACISPSGSANTRGSIFHPDFSDAETAAHTEPAYGGWYGAVGLQGDNTGVTTLYYWTGPGNYIFDVESDDGGDTLLGGSAGVEIFRLY